MQLLANWCLMQSNAQAGGNAIVVVQVFKTLDEFDMFYLARFGTKIPLTLIMIHIYCHYGCYSRHKNKTNMQPKKKKKMSLLRICKFKPFFHFMGCDSSGKMLCWRLRRW